jgi:hypothetical protein
MKKTKEQNQDQDKLNAYVKWLNGEYTNSLGLDTLRDVAEKSKLSWLIKSITNFDPVLGNYWRYSALSNLSYLLPIKKYEYTTIVLSISRQRNFTGSFRKVPGKQKVQFHTNYAFLYVSEGAFEYVSMGNTYKSADGEYRGRFIPVEQFNAAYNRFAEHIEPYEKYVLSSAKRGEFTLKSGVHLPLENGGARSQSGDILQKLDASRLAIRIYIIVYIISALQKIDGMQSNHTSDGYFESVLDDESLAKFEEIFNTQDKRHMRVLYGHITYLLARDHTVTSTICGQKIVPMRAKEVEDLENIRYNVWREIHISGIVSDLVINNITPSVPIFKDYMMLYSNAEDAKDLYDNVVNHIKFDHSVVASSIVRDLEGVRRQTFVIDPIKKKELFMSYRFEGLSDTIEVPMDYAEKNLIMSNYAACLLSEHLGTTFGDLPHMLRAQVLRYRIGPIFQNVLYFSKYVFECIYGLYCMNYHLGIIHSDLHVNNATTFDKLLLINVTTGEFHPNIKNPHVVYNVHGEHYIFPHMGRYAAVIDFSRGVISDEELQKSFPKKIARHILDKERKYIINRYQQLLPDFFRDNESALRAAVEDLFPAVFKLFSAIDAFIFSQGLKHMITTQILGNPENMKLYGNRKSIEEHILPLLSRIHEIAFAHLTSEMFKVISRKITNPDDIEWSNLVIIRECYQYAKIGNYNPLEDPTADVVTLVDYFNVDNKMKYNTRAYEDFPTICKLDEAVKRKLSFADVLAHNWKRYQEYLQEESLEEKSEKIREHELQEQKKRRGVQTEPSKKDIERIKNDPVFSSDELYYMT